MTTTLTDTTGGDIVAALAAERRSAGAVTSGLVLSLVIDVPESCVETAERAATAAAAAHPCRILFVVRHDLDADSRLDAEVQVGGRLGPGEAVVMRMSGRLALHAESVVLPLLAPDAPVVTWWPDTPPETLAHDPLAVFAGRRLTDCAQSADPLAALHRRAEDFAPGDTDLAWTRTTPWRGLLASAFDAVSDRPVGATVTAEQGNPSAALLAGWLRARLGLQVEEHFSAGPGITAARVDLTDPDGQSRAVEISRADGRMARLSRAGQPDRSLPLPRRELGELLAEELKHLDADQPYAAALSAWSGVSGLAERSPVRRHVWYDPAAEPKADPQAVGG